MDDNSTAEKIMKPCTINENYLSDLLDVFRLKIDLPFDRIKKSSTEIENKR